jgi:hypothetical protein
MSSSLLIVGTILIVAGALTIAFTEQREGRQFGWLLTGTGFATSLVVFVGSGILNLSSLTQWFTATNWREIGQIALKAATISITAAVGFRASFPAIARIAKRRKEVRKLRSIIMSELRSNRKMR